MPLDFGDATYLGGSTISALGSWLGADSQAGAIRSQNAANERLTREAWGRDDTAVQRRVADMQAAGLNPVLAAGNAAGNSAPLRMESEGASGLGGALQSMGQSVAGAVTAHDMRKRNAAATLQSEAQAAKASAEANIANKDFQDMLAGNDPRDKTPMNQLFKFLPRLVNNLSPGGAVTEAGKKAYGQAEEWAEKKARERYGAVSKRVDDLSRRMNNAIKSNDVAAARELSKQLDAAHAELERR